ncbi:ABC transporter permease [Candidatus Contubernalis alkaliaceticus]|uniref:ABC transporter permease n=1 Tax=Candidatus Contubernalis alkaliaceticus TaxID=338645 RepID=UPI001F4C1309|nr:ABC transporter permease [Candidatus Contubernalis alkalaceticus]UNC90730.1 ABC transporter permease [Candidatus Contubernalis alkalaceticus]
MTLFWIAFKDIILLLKDKKALLTLMATPLILTLILGMALGSLWSNETPPSRIYYSNQDEGALGSMLFDEIFALPELAARFNLEEINDQEKAREQVQRGEAVALINIPADFSSSLAEGKSTQISVLGDPGSSIRVQIVQSVVERFAAEVSARQVIYETLAETASLGHPPDSLLNPETGLQETADLVEEVFSSVEIGVSFEDGFVRAPSTTGPQAIDYYAAGMGVMYLLFTVSHGATRFLQERHDKTLARMLQSPTPHWQIAGGKFLGIFLMGLLQFGVIIAVSTLIFGVYWGNPLGVAMLTVTAAFAATGVGLVIAASVKTSESASAVGTFVVLSMAALGGSMFPTFAMPPWMQALTKITINGWAMDGFVMLMFSEVGPESVLLHSAVLTGAGIILCAFASWRIAGEV